ncbi:acetyltransferase-like isoleucine patch superfamily enzyme [Marmoricola sp. URHA0025 HA25]
MNRYSLGEQAKVVYALVLTKLRFRGARLVRRPVYFRGLRYAEIHPGLTTGYSCRFDVGGDDSTGTTLTIGRDCRMGDNVHVVAGRRVDIGHSCLMASKVFISDTSHGEYRGPNQSRADSSPHDRVLTYRPVSIGDNVWIGENVCILPGVTLGDGCIVNANAVVSTDFPAGSMIAGVPARLAKRWDDATGAWEPVG